MRAEYPGQAKAIKEIAEMDAWLWACDQIGATRINKICRGNITEIMAGKAADLELELASLTEEELRERWENGPW